jgi:hypothetical protein
MGTASELLDPGILPHHRGSRETSQFRSDPVIPLTALAALCRAKYAQIAHLLCSRNNSAMKRALIFVALLCALSWSAAAQDSRPAEDRFKSLIQKLNKEREAKNPIRPPPKRERPKETISQTEADLIAVDRIAKMIREQVSPCWTIPADKYRPWASVKIEIRMNPDGTYASSPRLLDSSRVRADPDLRALAITALRALRDPHCTPLRLPPEDYLLWKKLVYEFR